MTSPVPVWWVSLHEPEIIPRAYWDQGMLEAAMSGALWRTPGHPTFAHHEGDESALPDVDGAVVVIPARWHAEPSDVARINARIARLRWALVMLAGDEEGVFPRQALEHPRMGVWTWTPVPGRDTGSWRLLGDGWPPACPGLLAGMGQEARDRPALWFFSGQSTHRVRHDCLAALYTRRDRHGDGYLMPTGMFGESPTGYEDYLRRTAAAKTIPCPAGPVTPDTFRVFEALEAGCVPIVSSRAADGPDGYWPLLLGEEPPFPLINRWEPGLDEVLAQVETGWPANAIRVFAWWQAYKRRMAYWLRDDIARASGEPATFSRPEDLITVLVPTSPIPSHPDTAVIEETVASIRGQEGLGSCEILVMVDGVRPEQEHRRGDYEEYLRRLLWWANHEQRNMLPVVHDEHLHQAEMTRRTLDLVTTPLVLFVEHDTPLVGDVPWERLAAAIGTGRVNLIRLHHEASVLEPHRHLMLDRKPVVIEQVPLLRTVQWSQRPHLASTAFYRGMMEEFFGRDARTMIEDAMHGVLQTHWRELHDEGWDRFKVWMYAPDGDMKRSTHLDGRAGDDKYEMTWAYDTDEVPLGAPNPVRDEYSSVEAPPASPQDNPSPERPVLAAGRSASGVRVGIFGARADRRGLAVQTSELARHLSPTKVLGIDMGALSPYPNDWRDYDRGTLATLALGDVTPAAVTAWLDGLDVVLGCETFYVPWFTGLCAERGVRTVLVMNYEFSMHVAEWRPHPDVIAMPTSWHIEDVPGAILLPHGIDRDRLPFRPRTEARIFLHVVGHPAAHDRAGTRILLEAIAHVSTPIRLVLRSKQSLGPIRTVRHVEIDARVDDAPDYWSLYDDGDVLVLPRRYGGQCLPANEALSRGMPVLMPDCEPQSSWLPEGMRMRCSSRRAFRSSGFPGGKLPLHDIDPRVLAARIDELANDPAQVTALSLEADRVASEFSWEAVLPCYDSLFEQLVGSTLQR